MSEFVGRLWSNPAIRNASLQRKENQILSFVKENTEHLRTALKQPTFFPELAWDDIVRLLLSELTEKVIRTVEPRLEGTLHRMMQSAVTDRIYSDNKEKLSPVAMKEFLLNAIRSRQIREPCLVVLDAISHRFYERYVPLMAARKKVVYNELFRGEQDSLPQELMTDFLGFASLFRPLQYYPFPMSDTGETTMAQISDQNNRRMFENGLHSLGEHLEHHVGHVPSSILQIGLMSWQDPADMLHIPASSRLIKIAMGRMSDYDPEQSRKSDRGAETADKSWFNINRRNYKYSGYDARFLDEFYQIASEEGW